LKSLKVTESEILTYSNSARALSSLITSCRTLEYLGLKGSIRNVNIAKEITDGLMRAK
jgi:hypothetical protein